MAQLHWYQREAVDYTWRWMEQHTGNPCIVLPTGAGKTFVIAQMVSDAIAKKLRPIMVTHAAELIQQLARKLPDFGVNDFGIYSAMLDRRDTDTAVVLAGIQSIWNKADLFGPRGIILVDESHRINPRSETTQYGQLFKQFPRSRIVGLTATPYRLGSGLICGEDSWLNQITYEISVKQLINEGYLCKLRSKWLDGVDSSKFRIMSTGDYSEEDQQDAFLAKVREITIDMHKRCNDRKSVIVFCAGVKQAYAVQEILRDACGEYSCQVITGETPDHERAIYFEEFRRGLLRYLVNCNCLTEGFDARNVDCVVLQRATTSPGLYYQMAGRGLRTNPGKPECHVLDYGENISRHGPIDDIDPGQRRNKGKPGQAPVKTCPNCKEAVHLSAKQCPECDFVFEGERKINLSEKPSNDEIVSGAESSGSYIVVDRIELSVHTKTKADGSISKSLKVAYYDDFSKFPIGAEYIGFGYFRQAWKTDRWWSQFRTGRPLPSTPEQAAEILREHFENNPERTPSAIRIGPQKNNPKWTEVKAISFAKKYRDKKIEKAGGIQIEF